MRKLTLIFTFVVLMLCGGILLAQEDDTDTASDDGGSTVNYFFIACEERAIIDLTGTMEPGFDLYVQVFRGSSGSGAALSGLRRVSVSGDYQISVTPQYQNGEILALGQFASARILIAPEGRPEDFVFEGFADDVQDGCGEPSYSETGTTESQVIDPETGEVINAQPGDIVSSSGIFTPDGGVLNPVYFEDVAPESLVEIGARRSELEREIGRTNNPGLIFAECDAFPEADPGRLFDTDNIVVFWSWFARTPELVREHIDKAEYRVVLNSEFVAPQTFPNVVRSPVVRREDGNYWVFYTAVLGDKFRPGDYSIGYRVTWSEPLSDGYEEFGPGTENERIENTCSFTIEENPYGLDVSHRNPTVPLQQPE